MAKITTTALPSLWPAVSIRQISDLLDIDRDAIRRVIASGNLQPVGKGARGHATYDAGELIRALMARRGDADPAQLSPADRRNLAVARRQEFDLEQRRGQYLTRDSVRTGTARAFAVCASVIRSLPDVLERKMGLPTEGCDLAEQVVDGVLLTLSNDLEAIHNEANQQLAEG